MPYILSWDPSIISSQIYSEFFLLLTSYDTYTIYVYKTHQYSHWHYHINYSAMGMKLMQIHIHYVIMDGHQSSLAHLSIEQSCHITISVHCDTYTHILMFLFWHRLLASCISYCWNRVMTALLCWDKDMYLSLYDHDLIIGVCSILCENFSASLAEWHTSMLMNFMSVLFITWRSHTKIKSKESISCCP